MLFQHHHSTTAHRDDVDKSGNICIVYDVVFHPQALRLSEADKRIKDMLVSTALKGIQQRFPQHKLDPSALKYPKLKYVILILSDIYV